MQIAGMIFQTRSKARGCGIEKNQRQLQGSWKSYARIYD
ncbi:MAG: hypothetical protein ACLU6Y_08065 [Ruminococcus sp.]